MQTVSGFPGDVAKLVLEIVEVGSGEVRKRRQKGFGGTVIGILQSTPHKILLPEPLREEGRENFGLELLLDMQTKEAAGEDGGGGHYGMGEAV